MQIAISNKTVNLCASITGLIILACPSVASEKTVIRFVEKPQVQQHVVYLGDLVEIVTGGSQSVEQLLKLPLGPAPREGGWQTWHSQDVLQHLELRGQHSSSIRWTGVTEARLYRGSGPASSEHGSITPAFVQTRTIKLAEDLVSQAIREYLDLKTGERTDWLISVNIPPGLADVIRIRRNIVGIGGGQAPWLGPQEFLLQIKERDKINSLSITASVELPPMIIVAKRPLRRDEILSEEMLDYAPLPARITAEHANYFSDFQTLIGQQLKRSVSTGLPISSEYVGSPTVIERNEMIEVESVSGQIVVRTMARSITSGAVGELIQIETIPAKQRMLASVVGPYKVRVSAVATRGAVER